MTVVDDDFAGGTLIEQSVRIGERYIRLGVHPARVTRVPGESVTYHGTCYYVDNVAVTAEAFGLIVAMARLDGRT